MKYYRLLDDLEDPKRWFLKSLSVVDEKKMSVWKFVTPQIIHLPPAMNIKMTLREDGQPLDFTFADFDVLIVNEKVASFLSAEECQLIPVAIHTVKDSPQYFVAVLLKSADCLDESQSDFEKWNENDSIRPDLAGQYKSIYKLIIDPSKTHGYSIFRLSKFESAIIISEELKNKFQQNRVSGIRFQKVT